MQTGAWRQLVALNVAVLLVFSTTTWAAGPVFTGNLRVTGTVMANSVPMPDGGTVSSGDRIVTLAKSLAVISSPAEGRIEVRPDSEARFASDRVALHRGALAANRMAIEVDGFSIRPQDPARAWFAVAKRDGRLLVAAHRGNVIISAAGAPAVTVSEGSYATHIQGQEEPEKDKKKKKGAAGAAAGGGWTIGGLSHAASIALVIGIGAGAAAAVAGAAVALSNEKPSLSQ